jgi:hypothetical protein
VILRPVVVGVPFPQDSPARGANPDGKAWGMTEEEASGSETEGEPIPSVAPVESEEAANQAPASPAVPSVPAPAVPPAPAPSAPETASVEERKAALAQAVAGQIAQGYRVESQSEFQAVVVKGKRPSHLLHLVLTIITLGLWGIVWIILSITMHVHRRIVQVNEFGNTTVQHVKN